eukprot:gene12410-4912_t
MSGVLRQATFNTLKDESDKKYTEDKMVKPIYDGLEEMKERCRVAERKFDVFKAHHGSCGECAARADAVTQTGGES